MTGEQMQILDNDFFDQEVECLKRRVGQVECTKTHGEMVKTSLVSLFVCIFCVWVTYDYYGTLKKDAHSMLFIYLLWQR